MVAMPPDDQSLAPRPGSVIAETMGDETMVIDTESGVFFSLRSMASALWCLVEPGATRTALRDAVEEQYPESPSAGADVDQFLATLVERRVLVNLAAPAGPRAAVTWPATYARPVIEAHDDMSDLLLVDPLHDVDDTGWPRRR
jgi:hypothetical protein